MRSPLTLALSPNTKDVLGERAKLVETPTQGGARGSCLALALGYNPPPRWGSMKKKRPPAASRMSNLQQPGLPGLWYEAGPLTGREFLGKPGEPG